PHPPARIGSGHDACAPLPPAVFRFPVRLRHRRGGNPSDHGPSAGASERDRAAPAHRRTAVMLTALGALGALVFGLALVGDEDIGYGTTWVSAALALSVPSMARGVAGGRTARHARHLAEGLAAAGDA